MADRHETQREAIGTCRGPQCRPTNFVVAQAWLICAPFPASPLIETGIPLKSYEHYVSTPCGIKEIKERSFTLYLPANSVCFVPAGFLIGACYYKSPEKKASNKVPVDIGTLMVVPMPILSQITALGVPTQKAMKAWHDDATKENKSQMWRDHRDFLEKIFKDAQ